MRTAGNHLRRPGAAAAIGSWIVLVVIALAGCGATSSHSASQSDPTGAAPAIPAALEDHAIDVGGVRRTFLVYRPATLPAAAPAGRDAARRVRQRQQAEKSYHWDAEADAGTSWSPAYPDGLDRAWNTGGGCCGAPAGPGVDDVGFITAHGLRHQARGAGRPAPRYATGISNGGIMAYTLACRTTLFAAIGPDSATELGGCPDPARLSVIAIHGTADRNIPYARRRGDGIAHIDGPAIPALAPPGAASTTAPPRSPKPRAW